MKSVHFPNSAGSHLSEPMTIRQRKYALTSMSGRAMEERQIAPMQDAFEGNHSANNFARFFRFPR
jgi:hypothetical protein